MTANFLRPVYNRVYDSLEPELNLDYVEEVLQHILEGWGADEAVCSWKLNKRIGEYLQHHAKGRGILKTCAEKDVPVFVPAFTDSELGIDFALHNRLRKKKGKPLLRFDPFEDFEHYARPPCSPRGAWDSLLSVGECRAIGRSSSASMRSLLRAADTKNFRSSGTTTVCASVPSR